MTVTAPTELWLSNKAVKTLPSGAVYRVYALGGGYFDVGRGYAIKNDARVRYETPSKEKLAAVLCVQRVKANMVDVTMNGVAIGDPRAKVEAMYGKAKRKTKNAYGLYWEAYDQGGYQNFLLVSYDRDRVAAMYTNQPIVQTKKGTGIGTAKTVVEARYGRPLAVIQKKDGLYSIQNDEYDTYLVNGRYITFFYDRYNNNRVDGVLVVNRTLEDEKPGFTERRRRSCVRPMNIKFWISRMLRAACTGFRRSRGMRRRRRPPVNIAKIWRFITTSLTRICKDCRRLTA
ncbi:hypothetical protein LR69_01662 [Geobacillus sp. BCO2]|nr:hypothetical protein LR69_01662 [Geobacillus sp. BCO2]